MYMSELWKYVEIMSKTRKGIPRCYDMIPLK